MIKFKYMAPAVSVAALMSGSAAFAQVTAQEVWDDWKENLNVYGEEGITIGSEELSGGVLTVTDLGLSKVDDQATVTANLASIVFTEQGDGTVLVTMSDEYPISITTPNEDGTQGTVAFALRQSGMELLVSGTPDAMTYDISAARYALELDSVNDGTQDVAAEALFALNNLVGTYTVTNGDMRTMDYDVSAASLDLLLDVTDPDDGTVVNLSGKIEDIATAASMLMPLAENSTPDTIMQDGLAVEGGYTFGTSNYIFAVTQDGAETTGTATVAGGSLDAVVSKDSLGYSSSATGIAVNVTSAMMPFPVTISVAEYGLDLLMPMSQTTDPADFALGVNLSNLSVNEEIWAMFDPGAILPRDPATVLLDLTGTAKMLFDLTDPAQAEALAAAPVPGEIHSLSLNDLNVSFGGAQVTGTGAFTFDNTDTTTFPGMPRPLGEVTVNINGINGLIDKLVQMGLLPEDQVMMPRMMLGMFAMPVGEDMLTSKIEVNAEGQLLANGQRLQ